METKVNDKEIAELVFKSLCRTLKNKKIYHRFRCFIGYGHNDNEFVSLTSSIYSSLDCMKDICKIARDNCSQNPFYFTSNLQDIYNVMGNLNLERRLGNKESNAGKIQMRITQLINALIHNCVELTVRDFNMLEEIGQATFDLVCTKIFGKDFVDETVDNIPQNIKKIIDAQKSFMSISGTNDPRLIMNSKSFLDFLKERGLLNNDENVSFHLNLHNADELDECEDIFDDYI